MGINFELTLKDNETEEQFTIIGGKENLFYNEENYIRIFNKCLKTRGSFIYFNPRKETWKELEMFDEFYTDYIPLKTYGVIKFNLNVNYSK